MIGCARSLLRCCVRLVSDFGSNAHEREITDVYAAEFLSFCSNGDGHARHGANYPGGRTGGPGSTRRRIHSELFARMDAPLLSLVRAAHLGSWPDNEPVPMERSGGCRSGR